MAATEIAYLIILECCDVQGQRITYVTLQWLIRRLRSRAEHDHDDGRGH